MIALIQRVTSANVVVENQIIGEINQGILALIGVEKNDQQQNADRLLERLLSYRIFSDDQDKMNLSVADIGGEILLVPQFTLAADTRKGRRPSFSTAAPPQVGQSLFHYFVSQAKEKYSAVSTGEFGADMKVSLCNDGPVTFWLNA
ncbi:D-aminoacyl-tRNA deacylase [Aliikangiella coralliicola]|uniref:D-aminoacyl-tRNA deacylase n=1 Tax=Aliikangiella coralliicola TaxID=2592383 RepID=A0A545U7D5_9GAMM|nr:D-aminoacyl-tRNA deacylase [Aliikangiella coralliicola]TQV85385.1 D-tyrosyl-tRNA(Tyr) deacylase [Aliikangiella coralliicola]